MRLELNHRTRVMTAKIDRIQSSTGFLIESLQKALVETKCKSQRQIEETLMHNAELESRIMNAEMPKAEEDKLIQMCENRLILRNTVEARSIIH